ncbi:MAG TPA: glycosyl transferase [Bacteroidetes bacterium]|nr:glycosyl transferase [Bacteroidota bacterium]
MGDFYQTGVITTLHKLGKSDISEIERKLEAYKFIRPLSVVLPSIYAELEGTALPKILAVIKTVPYINQIVVTMGQTDAEQFDKVKRFFSVLPQEVKIVWNTGPRISFLYDLLSEHELNVGSDGKGRSVWMALGYIIAENKSRVVALHDCDILTYDRELLARLCFPVMSTTLDYEYCKGFYSRVTDRMHGRVTRLFVSPMIRALKKILGNVPLLNYLDSFRYPLAGEFSLAVDLARIIRIPGDWGLEVGALSEVYRTTSINRICQSEICDNYDHKHQVLSPNDPQKGLMKMSIDIAKSIFRNLGQEGVILSEGLLRTLQIAYLRVGQDTISHYDHDAAINNLYFDRHQEGQAVETFARSIMIAGQEVLKSPLDLPLTPNWNRVAAAVPNFFQLLLQAVEEDNS